MTLEGKPLRGLKKKIRRVICGMKGLTDEAKKEAVKLLEAQLKTGQLDDKRLGQIIHGKSKLKEIEKGLRGQGLSFKLVSDQQRETVFQLHTPETCPVCSFSQIGTSNEGRNFR